MKQNYITIFLIVSRRNTQFYFNDLHNITNTCILVTNAQITILNLPSTFVVKHRLYIALHVNLWQNSSPKFESSLTYYSDHDSSESEMTINSTTDEMPTKI